MAKILRNFGVKFANICRSDENNQNIRHVVDNFEEAMVQNKAIREILYPSKLPDEVEPRFFHLLK
jgi:hypothetical protein